ncbi:MAG: nuclear transport factor 2 family protein [Hyphomonadaceae bacterium]|nr:nuclear transport factor 2 family protein [Hyphomonadaceae bacterium]
MKTDRRTLMAGAGAALALPSLAEARMNVGTRAWYEAYVAAFNARDYPRFSAYYAPDVQFFGQAATLQGAEAIVAFYRGVHARIDERVDVLSFVGGGPTRFMAEIRTTLVAREDWPDFPTGPFTRGEQRQSINFAFYHLADGRFTRIRSARFSPLPNRPSRG